MDAFLIGLMGAAMAAALAGALRQRLNGNAFGARLPVITGALLALGSWWLPWLRFDVLNNVRLDEIQRFMAEMGIGVTQFLMEMGGSEQIEQAAALLGQEMPGWLVAALMPSAVLLPRIAIGLVFASGIGILIAIMLSFIPNETIQKISLGSTAIWSFTLAALLLSQIPAIDAWGTHNTFWQSLGVAVLGARMAWGAWIGFFGILFSGVGALMALNAEPPREDSRLWEQPDSFMSADYYSD